METYIGAVSVILYQNGIKVFEFSEPDFKIKELDGFRRQNLDVRSQEFGIIDGGSIIGSRVKTIERTVTVHFLGGVTGKNNVSQLLQGALSLTSDVTLGLVYFGTEYRCTGRFSRFEMSEGNLYEPLEIKFSVMCGDPYLTVRTRKEEWTSTENTIYNQSMVATLPRYMVVSASDSSEIPIRVRFTEIDISGNNVDVVDVSMPGGAGVQGFTFMWTYNPILKRSVDVPTGAALVDGQYMPFSSLGVPAGWQTVRVGEGGLKVEVNMGNYMSTTFSYPVKMKWV